MKTLKQLEIYLSWKTKRFATPLHKKLVHEGRTRWLDIGCGETFRDGFEYLDWLPSPMMPEDAAQRFHQKDISNLTAKDFDELGLFDLVRMQHVFEHFSYEDGAEVLKSCARLLKPGGLLLITVPDLRIFVKSYFRRRYPAKFAAFAQGRLPADVPASCYFSVFAHSFGYTRSEQYRNFRDQHKWCYDFEGLRHQIVRAGGFEKVTQLSLFNPLSFIPFTHNSAEEDLCVLAERS